MKYLIPLALLTVQLSAESCPSVDQLKNTQSPFDMYKKLPACFDAKRYDDAARLYLIFQVYGKYDTLRVSDRSAHQAIAVLRMGIPGMIASNEVETFQASLDPMLEDRTQICSLLTTLGRPDYHPSYMINHGLQAFGGVQLNGGIRLDFDPETGWKETLRDYLKCPLNREKN